MVSINLQERAPANFSPVSGMKFAGMHSCKFQSSLSNEIFRKALDKICMMMTRLACNRAIESSYWRMDSDSDVGLLMGYVLYQLPVELEFMDLDTFPR
jgi:hypothetical protein